MARTTTERPDRIALVTAASRGIGAACARELQRRGYRLALLSRSEAVRTVAAELGAVAHVGSVARDEDLAALVRLALDRHGRVDAVVVSTGHPPKGELLRIADADWHGALDLLLLNVIRLMRHVVPVMERQGGGAIVNISSLFAVQPDLRYPVSSALRAALGAFTKLFADRYAPSGIRMNCILPGYVDTLPADPQTLAAIPLRRAARAEEIAHTAAFLLSDDAGAITGQSIRVDGGLGRMA